MKHHVQFDVHSHAQPGTVRPNVSKAFSRFQSLWGLILPWPRCRFDAIAWVKRDSTAGASLTFTSWPVTRSRTLILGCAPATQTHGWPVLASLVQTQLFKLASTFSISQRGDLVQAWEIQWAGFRLTSSSRKT